MLFMALYYRGLGLIADLALIAYGVLFFAVIKLVPITLTLPGIAGMVLTIGVAADANVVIFERIREEARAGRSPRTAIQNGYKKGISAIIDANVVTLITAAIIYLLATGGPKGFAFTLFIGVMLSLFTSVLATRAVFGLLVDSPLFQNARFMGYNQKEVKWKFDFVGKWKLWLAISLVPMLAGVIFISTKGIEKGLDFRGGTAITTTYPAGKLPNEKAVRDVLTSLGQTDARVQASTSSTTGEQQYLITTKPLQPAAEAKVKAALRSKFEASFGSTNSVGASFGAQLIKNAIVAIVFSFLVIIGYLSFRFEYKLALPALLSVVHDVWLALSIYSITGREVTNATVAALLTILGYSLYDVVIVFDRIRENAPIMRTSRYRAIVNRSVHETLTRSIITSVLTLLPVLALFLFGGDTLKDFSFALLVGILSGGISSILISAPLAALWKEREPDAQKRERREAKKAARQTDVDSDVVDVAALARAEAALKADEPGLRSSEPSGLDGLSRPADDVDDVAEAPAPSSTDATTEVGTTTTEGSSDRERRHRQVQRKRRKR
jgi:SecD/SecF fusion protein